MRHSGPQRSRKNDPAQTHRRRPHPGFRAHRHHNRRATALCSGDGLLFDDVRIQTQWDWLCPDMDDPWITRLAQTLVPLHHTSPGRLSAGQRQWVALALTMASHADLFLFDEPLQHLDSVHTAQFLEFMVHRPAHKAFVVTGHPDSGDLWSAVLPCIPMHVSPGP